MSNLRDHIASVNDLPEEIVPVPEWGNCKVLIIGMTAKQRASFAISAGSDDRDPEEMTPDERANQLAGGSVRLIIECAHDPETREKVFTDDDYDMLLGKSGRALERLSQVALRLAGMAEEVQAEAQEQFRGGDGA